jgi:hypothetical protein
VEDDPELDWLDLVQVLQEDIVRDYLTAKWIFVIDSELDALVEIGVNRMRQAHVLYPELKRYSHYKRFNRAVPCSVPVGTDIAGHPGFDVLLQTSTGGLTTLNRWVTRHHGKPLHLLVSASVS